MARKGFKPDQITHMLREAEAKLAGGSTVGEACQSLVISEQSSSNGTALEFSDAVFRPLK